MTASKARQKVPASCPNKPLRLRVEFPNCWNGRNLDSADHKSHMAYAGVNGARGCPASHPVAVPSLSLNFRWKISGSLSGVRLSSGGVYSGMPTSGTPGINASRRSWCATA